MTVLKAIKVQRVRLRGACRKCGADVTMSVVPGSVSRITGDVGEPLDCWCPACAKKVVLTVDQRTERLAGYEQPASEHDLEPAAAGEEF